MAPLRERLPAKSATQSTRSAGGSLQFNRGECLLCHAAIVALWHMASDLRVMMSAGLHQRTIAYSVDTRFRADFSRPGEPTDNAFIEVFNGRLHAEC